MKAQPVVVKGKIRLKDFDPKFNAGLDKEKTKQKTDELNRRIGEMQQLLYAHSHHSILLIFQGVDASGKDGSIRRVLNYVDPAGVETANFKTPSTEELAHDFLWRVHKRVPRYGNIGVFNRSHYEGVIAERILNIVPERIWSKRYQQIVDFERMLVESNVVIVKFYLHISKEEQAERLQERLINPRKNWKFAHSDLEMRRRWNDYMKAYEDMLNKTSHADARWHIIPGDRNWYRDYVISQTVVQAIDGLHMDWPKPKEDLSDIRIV